MDKTLIRPDRLKRVKDGARSHSQLKEWKECAYRYKLRRVDRVWDRPAAWFAQGTAVHAAIEAYERSGRSMALEDAQEVFQRSYAEEITRACETTPNFSYWFNSGRYGGEEDIERRFRIGLDQVAGYLDYVAEHPNEQIWVTPDDAPAIELPFSVDLKGVKVTGFIDQVIHNTETGEIRVRDIKTGANPGDTLQLAIYAVAVNLEYGMSVTTGDYWMARDRRPYPARQPFDLTDWTTERIEIEFQELDQGIKDERFDPLPDERKCVRCGVSLSCPFAVIGPM